MADNSPLNLVSLFGSIPSFNHLTDIVKTPFGLSLSDIRLTWEDHQVTDIPPLTLNDFPDSTDSRIHAGAVACVLEVLSKGFKHPTYNPDSPVPGDLWLLLVTNLLQHVCSSIAVTFRSAEGPGKVFDELNGKEALLLSAVAENAEALDGFFTSCEVDPKGWSQCMSCLNRFHVSLLEMDWEAIMGDASGNICTAHTIHINATVCTLV